MQVRVERLLATRDFFDPRLLNKLQSEREVVDNFLVGIDTNTIRKASLPLSMDDGENDLEVVEGPSRVKVLAFPPKGSSRVCPFFLVVFFFNFFSDTFVGEENSVWWEGAWNQRSASTCPIIRRAR
jgi:hypothetical protein